MISSSAPQSESSESGASESGESLRHMDAKLQQASPYVWLSLSQSSLHLTPNPNSAPGTWGWYCKIRYQPVISCFASQTLHNRRPELFVATISLAAVTKNELTARTKASSSWSFTVERGRSAWRELGKLLLAH